MPIQEYNNKIAENIYKLRLEKGWSQDTLAARLQVLGINYTRGKLSMVETKKRPPTALLIIGCKLVFGCEYAALIGEVETQLAKYL